MNTAVRTPFFQAVLFDCDGVLVDSEPITNGVLREMLAEGGWTLSEDECMRLFVGKAIKEEAATIAAHSRITVDDAWLKSFRQRRDERLLEQVQLMPGAMDAVQSAHRHTGGRVACASGADRPKVMMQLQRCGLMPWIESNHVFSGHDLLRTKPAPDVYLAAAAALGLPPKLCLVIEDTPTGVTAGMAAGATVWALRNAATTDQALLAAGATRLFDHMQDLPAMWAQGLGAPVS